MTIALHVVCMLPGMHGGEKMCFALSPASTGSILQATYQHTQYTLDGTMQGAHDGVDSAEESL